MAEGIRAIAPNLCNSVHSYTTPDNTDRPGRGSGAGGRMQPGIRWSYPASCIRTSENAPSRTLVNKGEKKGRGSFGACLGPLSCSLGGASLYV